MTSLHAAVTDPVAAGLYRLGSRTTPATVRRTSESAGRLFLPLDGIKIVDKRTFLRACADTFRFPAYAGRNWDALEEALRDLSWLAQPDLRGYVALLDPAAPFIREAATDWSTARAILQSTISHWRATPTPLTILLRRAGDLASDLPAIAERASSGS
jgi:hypothetical protein